MIRRQSLPEQWLIVNHAMSGRLWAALRRLPRGSGVLVLGKLSAPDKRRLRTLARLRHLTIRIESARTAARVHDIQELRRALFQRTPMILLSPMFPTPSHPDWEPMPRMRAASLARIAGRRLIALGGLNPKRYLTVAPLGFSGWAGISAWVTFTNDEAPFGAFPSA
jgi:thiamine-phosphate pyrophosphorylase